MSLKHFFIALVLCAVLCAVTPSPAQAQPGLIAPNFPFWGVLVTDPTDEGQWLPFAMYPDARSARLAVNQLRRRGLKAQMLLGAGNQLELARHAISAERGRQLLLSRLSETRQDELDEDFCLSDRRNERNGRNGQFGRGERNPIAVGGFNPARQDAIMAAGFDEQRRRTVNQAGFDPGRRATIDQGGFSGSRLGTPNRSPRGNFGTQQQTTPNTRRGNFGTQGTPTTRNRGPGFGTQ